MPLVSLCLPTRNRARLLGETLPSILNQTYPHLEILISDNASTDSTPSVCARAAQADSRVRVVRQPRNLGLFGNHNFLIEQSRGTYLALVHDDEWYAPAWARCHVEFLEAHPEAGLACSDWDLMDAEGRTIGTRRFRSEPVLPGREYISRTIRSGRSALNCPGTMIRRSALGPVRFDENGPTGFTDFAVWFEVAETSGVGHIPQPLWKYRIHKGALSSKSILAVGQDYARAILRYLEGYQKRWPGDAESVRAWRRSLNRYLFFSLVYELYRLEHPRTAAGDHTIFDLMDYRLTPQERLRALELLKTYEEGPLAKAVRRATEFLVRAHLTRPLEWALRMLPVQRFRSLLGLR